MGEKKNTLGLADRIMIYEALKGNLEVVGDELCRYVTGKSDTEMAKELSVNGKKFTTANIETVRKEMFGYLQPTIKAEAPDLAALTARVEALEQAIFAAGAKSEEARMFLLHELRNGPAKREDVEKLAATRGIPALALRVAMHDMNVRHFTNGSGAGLMLAGQS